MQFLAATPERRRSRCRQFCRERPEVLPAEQLEETIAASVLDNLASPSVNLNTFHARLGDRREDYQALQWAVQALLEELLHEAAQQGLGNSFSSTTLPTWAATRAARSG